MSLNLSTEGSTEGYTEGYTEGSLTAGRGNDMAEPFVKLPNKVSRAQDASTPG